MVRALTHRGSCLFCHSFSTSGCPSIVHGFAIYIFFQRKSDDDDDDDIGHHHIVVLALSSAEFDGKGSDECKGNVSKLVPSSDFL